MMRPQSPETPECSVASSMASTKMELRGKLFLSCSVHGGNKRT